MLPLRSRPRRFKAQHDEVKTLAADIIRDQEKEIAQMRESRTAWYPTAPAISAATH